MSPLAILCGGLLGIAGVMALAFVAIVYRFGLWLDELGP